MSHKRIILVTTGIMPSLFSALMESTVVATTIPVSLSPLSEASDQIACCIQHVNIH